ncbi:DUF2778 domain-containing protein [Erwinia tracheiphila]|uniref:DUF2778 domain-containing protein n=1 Tax=Erwinia tracheiphila TaxID=65700 RepID=A0A345CTM7_9GAMM|nr:tlde1 domain-containing protein [Erwinia tracheiphila]AXF76794.1 DUF2778 domain-containing protein [Erwinia tracheiphila]UIA84528.1 DUF2778 domain-containing protein [Erwinia tracheiphila]UIA93121.1 DUF2778 domain-containing protein [Erwinia tracheiphila]
MPWEYYVRKAEFYLNGEFRFTANYAGARGFYNDPDFECEKNKGPLPRGRYRIEPPRDSDRTGRYTLPLTPNSANNMCNRVAFAIHGDSIRDPGGASQGCIILKLKFREALWDSGDRELIVK